MILLFIVLFLLSLLFFVLLFYELARPNTIPFSEEDKRKFNESIKSLEFFRYFKDNIDSELLLEVLDTFSKYNPGTEKLELVAFWVFHPDKKIANYCQDFLINTFQKLSLDLQIKYIKLIISELQIFYTKFYNVPDTNNYKKNRLLFDKWFFNHTGLEMFINTFIIVLKIPTSKLPMKVPFLIADIMIKRDLLFIETFTLNLVNEKIKPLNTKNLLLIMGFISFISGYVLKIISYIPQQRRVAVFASLSLSCWSLSFGVSTLPKSPEEVQPRSPVESLAMIQKSQSPNPGIYEEKQSDRGQQFAYKKPPSQEFPALSPLPLPSRLFGPQVPKSLSRSTLIPGPSMNTWLRTKPEDIRQLSGRTLVVPKAIASSNFESPIQIVMSRPSSKKIDLIQQVDLVQGSNKSKFDFTDDIAGVQDITEQTLLSAAKNPNAITAFLSVDIVNGKPKMFVYLPAKMNQTTKNIITRAKPIILNLLTYWQNNNLLPAYAQGINVSNTVFLKMDSAHILPKNIGIIIGLKSGVDNDGSTTMSVDEFVHAQIDLEDSFTINLTQPDIFKSLEGAFKKAEKAILNFPNAVDKDGNPLTFKTVRYDRNTDAFFLYIKYDAALYSTLAKEELNNARSYLKKVPVSLSTDFYVNRRYYYLIANKKASLEAAQVGINGGYDVFNKSKVVEPAVLESSEDFLNRHKQFLQLVTDAKINQIRLKRAIFPGYPSGIIDLTTLASGGNFPNSPFKPDEVKECVWMLNQWENDILYLLRKESECIKEYNDSLAFYKLTSNLQEFDPPTILRNIEMTQEFQNITRTDTTNAAVIHNINNLKRSLNNS